MLNINCGKFAAICHPLINNNHIIMLCFIGSVKITEFSYNKKEKYLKVNSPLTLPYIVTQDAFSVDVSILSSCINNIKLTIAKIMI